MFHHKSSFATLKMVLIILVTSLHLIPNEIVGAPADLKDRYVGQRSGANEPQAERDDVAIAEYYGANDKIKFAPAVKKRSNLVDSMFDQQLEPLQHEPQYQQRQRITGYQKAALKKKMHKLVDDMIESEFSSAKDAAANMYNVPDTKDGDNYKPKKKWQTNNDDKIMIIMKDPENPDSFDAETLSGSNAGPLSALVLNALNQWDEAQQRQQQVTRPKQASRIDDHNRRVLDDKFGIMKESIFTTNNHLGHKEVPKFGSEEVF